MLKVNKFTIVAIFRYIWLIVAAGIILYIVSQAIVTKRQLVYQIDNSDSITRDITGWYPEQRLELDSSNQSLQLISEPVYMQVYVPVDFEFLTVAGDIYFNNENIRLGLKQKDGSWDYRNIDKNNFSLNFDLANAQIKKNKLEFILSVPDLTATSSVILSDNWSLSLEK